MKLVVEGASGSGKSTAIRRLLKYLERPIWGLWSEKLPAAEDAPAPVYLHSYRAPVAYGKENRIGVCKNRHAQSFPAVFDTLGVEALREIPPGSLVLLDEIGVMESDAAAFQRELFHILDGDYDVVVAVRDRHTPLLDAIRSHPAVLCLPAAEVNDEARCRALAAELAGTPEAEGRRGP